MFRCVKDTLINSFCIQFLSTMSNSESIPRELNQKSCSDPSSTPCINFAVDNIQKFKQTKFVIRDSFLSYTYFFVINDKRPKTELI